jgi:glucose-1-phosphate cytidylyltransferase
MICPGYRGYVIEEHFANYFLHVCDVTFDVSENTMEARQQHVVRGVLEDHAGRPRTGFDDGRCAST